MTLQRTVLKFRWGDARLACLHWILFLRATETKPPPPHFSYGHQSYFFPAKYKHTWVYSATLYWTLQILCFFIDWKFVTTLCWTPFFQQHFLTSCHFVSCFGNFCNMSNFFIIIVSVTVIYCQWSVTLLLQKDYNLLHPQMMVSIFLAVGYFIITYFVLYKHNIIAHLPDYSIV